MCMIRLARRIVPALQGRHSLVQVAIMEEPIPETPSKETDRLSESCASRLSMALVSADIRLSRALLTPTGRRHQLWCSHGGWNDGLVPRSVPD